MSYEFKKVATTEYVDKSISSIGNGTQGVYDSLTALQTAFPNGTSGIYVTSDNGHWYYWNGSAWTDGGVYQATEIADNSITKNKIVSGLANNITLENKLLNILIINKDSVTSKVGLYNADGVYDSIYTKYRCVELDITGCDYIEWDQLRNVEWPTYLAYLKADGKRGSIPNTSGKKRLDLKDIVKIYINFFGSEYCDNFIVHKDDFIIHENDFINKNKDDVLLKINNKLIINKDNIYYRTGCFLNFNDYQPTYTDHQCTYIIKCNNLKSVSYKSGGYSFPEVVWKDKNNNIYSKVNNTTDYITIDVSNAVEIAFNFFNKRNVSYEITFKSAETNISLNKYNHYNNKGLIFNNTKTALFVGDSITQGFTSGSTTTPNGYPKLFSDIYNMRYYNEAVGGAEYCNDGDYQGNLIPKMLTQITNSTHKDVNYLFIAGGVNDWQSQNDLTTFKNAVSDTIDYALNNYPNAHIILITPINTTKSFNTTPKNISLQEYRNVITEVAISKNNNRITIIQGYLFNFPDETNNSFYINAMFGDGLHPSELGYATAYLYGLIDSLS